MEIESIIHLAGILDRDGSIMIELQSKNKVKKYDYSPLYSMRLVVTNTDLYLINWLKNKFGGNIGTRTSILDKKVTYDWNLYSQQASNLIKLSLPYLIIKKQKALIFIEFSDTIGKTGLNVTEEIRNTRQRLYDEMKILNKQGI